MNRKFISAAAAFLFLTGCGSDSTAVSEPAEQDRTFAAVLSDRLDSGDYDIAFQISGGNLDDMAVEIRRSGDDGFVSMDNSGVYTEIFKTNKQTYMILPEIHCYQLNDEYGSFGNAFIKLGKGDVLSGVSEENGKTTEIYRSPTGSGSDADTFTFVFDTAKGAEGLEHITQETSAGTVEIDVSKVQFSSEPVNLPELSEYDNITDGEMISEVAQVRFYMYYTFGLNEQEVAEMGYDYDEIAHMKYDEQQEFYAELGEKLKGSDSSE